MKLTENCFHENPKIKRSSKATNCKMSLTLIDGIVICVEPLIVWILAYLASVWKHIAIETGNIDSILT